MFQPTAIPHGLPETRLNASDYQAHDLFGFAVDLDGPLLVAGAPGKDDAGQEAGGVYAFEHHGGEWVETARLIPDSRGDNAGLGMAVAIDGETIAAGAPYATTQAGGFAAGAVYVYVRQGREWRAQARLTTPDGSPFDLFGGSLALEGDTLVVGAQGVDNPRAGRNAGAAYVYQREGEAWVEQARLSSQDGADDDFFGQAVAIYGEVIAVGAYGHDNLAGGPNSGAVYLFRRQAGAWFYQAKLTSAEPTSKAQFGYSLDLAGPNAEPAWLLVGANQYAAEPVDPRYEAPSGQVELFHWQKQTWQSSVQLGPPEGDEMESGLVGATVAMEWLDGDRFALAAGSQFGRSMHLFQRRGTTWGAPLAIQPAEFQEFFFGRSISISDPYLAVGSSRSAERLPDGQFFTEVSQSGAVFIYDLGELKK
jgi:hypothetical protein